MNTLLILSLLTMKMVFCKGCLHQRWQCCCCCCCLWWKLLTSPFHCNIQLRYSDHRRRPLKGALQYIQVLLFSKLFVEGGDIVVDCCSCRWWWWSERTFSSNRLIEFYGKDYQSTILIVVQQQQQWERQIRNQESVKSVANLSRHFSVKTAYAREIFNPRSCQVMEAKEKVDWVTGGGGGGVDKSLKQCCRW